MLIALMTYSKTGHSPDCCVPENEALSEATCFKAEDRSSTSNVLQRCVPPLSVLQPDAPSPKRCIESMDCGHGSLCAQQPQNVPLLRITFRMQQGLQHDKVEPIVKTVVWRGPGEELLEEGTIRNLCCALLLLTGIGSQSQQVCASLAIPPRQSAKYHRFGVQVSLIL